jgi:succinoglycan biosynthesis transport protein ExoP
MDIRTAVPQLDLERLWYMIRERWWLVAGTTLIGLACALFVLSRATPIYIATALVRVEQTPKLVASIPDANTEDLRTLESLKTIERSLLGRPLMEGVVRRLKLTPADLSLPQAAATYSESALVDKLAGSVSVQLERGTRLINVSAESEKPEVAQKIPTALIDEYIAQVVTQRSTLLLEKIRFLEREADRAKKRLEESEHKLQEYKANVEEGASLESSQNIVVEQLKELTGNLTEVKAARLKLESDVAQIQALQDAPPEKLLVVSSIAADPAVAERQRQIAEHEALLANYRQRYLPKHPKWKQAESQLQGLREGLAHAVKNAADAIGTKYEAAVRTERLYSDALREQEAVAIKLNERAIPYNSLKGDVETNRQLYDAVLKELKETTLTQNLGELLRVVDTPQLPDRPDKPRKKLILAAGLAGGFMPGVALCLLLGFLDRSYRTVDHAERGVGLPALGAISKMPKDAQSSLPVHDDPGGLQAESFRSLRIQLMLRAAPKGGRSFLFTSAAAGEGKSFCAANCAVAFAQLGHKTLLIDADLRLPSLAPMLEVPADATGLADYLGGNVPFPELPLPTFIENLSIVPAGKLRRSPAELIASDLFSRLMSEAEWMFDHVVMDTPPVLAVSDALLLSRLADNICLVIKAGETSRGAVARSVRVLQEAGSAPCGFVLNMLPVAKGKTYGYYYSATQYATGYDPQSAV